MPNCADKASRVKTFSTATLAVLEGHVESRYNGWEQSFGSDILGGKLGLADLDDYIRTRNPELEPTSGRQEFLENTVARIVT